MGREGEIFHLLGQEPGAPSPILVSHIMAEVYLWALFCCSPQCIGRKLDQEQNSQDSNQHSDVGCP